MMPDGECAIGAENKARIDAGEKDRSALWAAVEKLRDKMDRLPAWATLLMSGLAAVAGGAIGALVTVLV